MESGLKGGASARGCSQTREVAPTDLRTMSEIYI